MTETSKTQNPNCHFCQGIVTAVKQEARYVEAENADLPDTMTVELLPICKPCSEYYYDGTEEFPKLLPLTALAG